MTDAENMMLARALAVVTYCGRPALRELTLFKHRYQLEASGFTKKEAAHLVFTKWRLHRALRTEQTGQHKTVQLWRRHD